MYERVLRYVDNTAADLGPETGETRTMSGATLTLERARFEELLDELAGSTGGGWVVNERKTRDLSWRVFSRRGEDPPEQGWKVHVSVAACEANVLFGGVLPLLVRRGVAFKLPSSVAGICTLNSGEAGESQVGKVLTASPQTTEQAVELAGELDRLLPESRGPAVPSDVTLRRGSPVSLRYGVMGGGRLAIDSTGFPSFTIRRPDGTHAPDERHLDGAQPDWVPPLPANCFRPEAPDPSAEVVAGGRRFLPLALLYRSPLGSVRLGLDVESIENVILKSARARLGGDPRGFDARDRLLNEHRVLQALPSRCEIAPRPLAFADGDEPVLVLEDAGGVSFESLTREEKFKRLPEFAAAVARLHELGYVHGDLKPSNCLVTETSICLIDFGLAAADGTCDGPLGGTRVYDSPEGTAGRVSFARDLHALGVCVAHVALGREPSLLAAGSGRLVGLLHLAGAHRAASIVRGLVARDPERRTAAAVAATQLEGLEDEAAAVGRPRSGVRARESVSRARWCMRAALEAGAATRGFVEPSEAGHWWRNTHHFADFACEGVNLGAAGIILGLASLDGALGTRRFRRDVDGGADWLAARGPMPNAAGLFTGNAGAALALALVAKRHGRAELLPHVRRRLEAAAAPSSEFDLFSGAAGVVWAGCIIAAVLGKKWPAAVVKKSARALLAAASRERGVRVWPASETMRDSEPGPYLGAAHGSAGIAMALAVWGRVTGERRPRQLAAETFMSLYEGGLDESGKSFYYKLNEDPRPTAASDWCHGTAGYLWCLLQAFGDEPTLAAQIDWAVGVLAELPAVLATNPTYCHGLAGLLELWRMVSAVARHRAVALDRLASVEATLRLTCARSGGQTYWCSDDPTVVTPDLWIGFLAPATALALHATGRRAALLSEEWLSECARVRDARGGDVDLCTPNSTEKSHGPSSPS